ncbi:hypothetical protein BSY238_1659 [Methyloversatilis sp. RAC08]|uniref:hypothetical protein n=1 Tax=Methyloversatilis sp. RAC08 TaxID=1842540 RepID=UPI00083D5F12|nr:hypothetical protein [Methyloversatilis sp. RAC08]AOF83325.1 hypothetical protein BSY238_1659 [Methyloversatilis sp. RAC08]
MSRTDPPIARHFRQILMWPLRLMPLRSGDQVQRHPQALAAITDGNPWREQRDEFTGSPVDFHERHYREFVTFLPVTGSCWASLRSPQPTQVPRPQSRECARDQPPRKSITRRLG